MSESVVVGVRVRPFNQREIDLEATCCIDMDGPKTSIRDGVGGNKDFTFDESFWSHDDFEDDGAGYSVSVAGSNYADQRRVYDVFGERVLNNAWDGFHCCLFAYGQTGSGKSYSMVGYGANKGIVPISCEEIFLRIDKNPNKNLRFEVSVSMVEIYNECVQDLLIFPEDRPKKGLEIRESKHLGIYIDGVIKRPVDTYPMIEAVIEEATSHRTVGSTLMNATSSRAHTVQCIEFRQIELVGGTTLSNAAARLMGKKATAVDNAALAVTAMKGGKEQIKLSMINLVDLAGSEKAGQTGASGDRLKEGAAINKSLSALGLVIEKLAERSGGKKNVIIPYRDSKLTRLLQNALGGSSKTIMICALSPASSNYEETLSTLRYADRAKKIKNNATINENPQDRLLRELREENQKLLELLEKFQSGQSVSVQEISQLKEEQEEIAEIQAALADMSTPWKERLKQDEEKHTAMIQQHERDANKRCTLMYGAGTCGQPMLVNLNSDPQLTGKIKYVLEPNQLMHVGNSASVGEEPNDSDSSASEEDSSVKSLPKAGPEILLMHKSIFAEHASLLNAGERVVLRSCGVAAGATCVNGLSVTEMEYTSHSRIVDSGTVGLEHGDRIVFGECLFFLCFADDVPERMLTSCEVDYNMAFKELYDSHEHPEGVSKSVCGVRQLMKDVLKNSLDPCLLRKKIEEKTAEVWGLRRQNAAMKRKEEEANKLQAKLVGLAGSKDGDNNGEMEALLAELGQALNEVPDGTKDEDRDREMLAELGHAFHERRDNDGQVRALRAELASLKGSHDKTRMAELAALKESHEEALCAQLQSQNEAHLAELAVCKASHDEALPVLKQSHDEALRAQLAASKQSHGEALRAQLQSHNEVHSAELGRLKQAHAEALCAQMATLKKSHDEALCTELAASKGSHDEGLRAELAASKQSHDEALRAQLAELKGSHGEVLRAELAALKKSHGEEILSHQKELEGVNAAKERDTISCEQLRKEMDIRYAEHAGAKEQWSKDMAMLHSQHTAYDAEMKALKETNGGACAELAALKALKDMNDEETKSLRTELQALKEAKEKEKSSFEQSCKENEQLDKNTAVLHAKTTGAWEQLSKDMAMLHEQHVGAKQQWDKDTAKVLAQHEKALESEKQNRRSEVEHVTKDLQMKMEKLVADHSFALQTVKHSAVETGSKELAKVLAKQVTERHVTRAATTKDLEFRINELEGLLGTTDGICPSAPKVASLDEALGVLDFTEASLVKMAGRCMAAQPTPKARRKKRPPTAEKQSKKL